MLYPNLAEVFGSRPSVIELLLVALMVTHFVQQTYSISSHAPVIDSFRWPSDVLARLAQSTVVLGSSAYGGASHSTLAARAVMEMVWLSPARSKGCAETMREGVVVLRPMKR